MNIRKFKIASGNEAALVWGASLLDKALLAKNLLPNEERFGFVDLGDNPELEIKGNELCINTILAVGFAFPGYGEVKLNSGRVVEYERYSDSVKIKNLEYSLLDNNVVLFDNVGYRVVDDQNYGSKKYAARLAAKYELPAFGLVYANGNEIKTKLYRQSGDSFADEAACGLGIIASCLVNNISYVEQPTGESIKITKGKNFFDVEARVAEI